MRRLKNPITKEVSLALNPATKKKFLFIKEDTKMNELKDINDKLALLLGQEITKDESKPETEESILTAIDNKIKEIETTMAKSTDTKSEVAKANDPKISDIIVILRQVVDYLTKLEAKIQKPGYGYGYPAPAGKDESTPVEPTKKEEAKATEPVKSEPEVLYTVDEVRQIIEEVKDGKR